MFSRVVMAAVCLAVLGACEGRLTGPAPVGSASPGEFGLASHAQDVPFEGSVTGTVSHVVANPRGCAAGYTSISVASGTASHLGLVTGDAQHCTTQTGMAGDLVITAANGDKLYASYLLAPTAAPVLGEELLIAGTMTISGGTGRFADASGTTAARAWVVWQGYQDPEWPLRWDWDGRLSY